MDVDEVWRAIDAERASLAELLEQLTPEQWDTASLCAGWRVREVGAHLTLAQMGPAQAVLNLARAGGSFNRMIRDTAVRQARLPVQDYPALLRAMIGSRRKAPGITALEPLCDALVHGQDMAVPLGLDRPMPLPAAAAVGTRVWQMGFPFGARRRLAGFRLSATDCGWTTGEGDPVEGRMADLVLLLTGRDVAVDRLSGAGAERLRRLVRAGR